MKLKNSALKCLSLSLCLFVSMFLCLFVSNLISCSGEKEPGQLGQAIPFTLPAVDSVKYNLQDYRDKIVLLHFWADWCPHCRKEFAKLQKASDELEGQGLEILAINVGQDREHVLELKQEYQLTIPLLLDDKKEVAENYGVTGLPTSFFIDSRGKIREKIIGWLTEGKIRSVFEKIAAGN